MNKNTVSKGFIATSIGLWLGLIGTIALGAEPAPGKPLATCNDGMVMTSTTGDHRGACSGHGGVKAWADGSPVHSHVPKTSYKRGK